MPTITARQKSRRCTCRTRCSCRRIGRSYSGLRYDQFDVDFDNHRTGDTFSTSDDLLSPRAGLVFKPIEPLSLYASYSKSYQPRAGEQLGSLSLTNAALDPEEYTNYEIGAKWDVLPNLAFTAAAYQLDRNNVAVADPNDSTRLILIDGQRTKGIELAFTGNVTECLEHRRILCLSGRRTAE